MCGNDQCSGADAARLEMKTGFPGMFSLFIEAMLDFELLKVQLD